MASVGHLIAATAAARLVGPYWRAVAVLTVVSFLPDADVLAFRFGIPYSAEFGHRGATHSLVFALLSGSVAALVLWRVGVKSAWAWPVAVAVALSHPLLDALTDGGLGVALYWPFSEARLFFPWRPLPVAPIGARFLTERGLGVALLEVYALLPLLVTSLLPVRTERPPAT